MSGNTTFPVASTEEGRATRVTAGGIAIALVGDGTPNTPAIVVASDLARRISAATANLRPYYRSILAKLAADCAENADTVCNFITAEQNEINISDSTREWKIKVLVWLSGRLGHKLFQQMTKQDILEYLGTLRKTDAEDPTHKWIGTYNNRQMLLNKFFRWLYNPDEPDNRLRVTPPCMRGVKRLPRKERSPYNPTDIWTPEEHAVFLKYCPSKRDKCYHAMANDTSARPHELLKLKIGDIHFKLSPDGIQYAEVTVTGKTRSRTLPLISSLPYAKDWLQEHPMGNNKEAPLFVSLSDQNFGRAIARDGLGRQYKEQYKERYFPRLLEGGGLSPREKAIIKVLLTKPWNLYVFRHSALTDKSQILKEHVLRDHAGWTMSSKMPQVYLHYFGTESSNSLLEAHGIVKHRENRNQSLRSKYCPNCCEPNKPDARFCAKCRMILSYDAYVEASRTEMTKTDAFASLSDQLLKLTEEVERLTNERRDVAQMAASTDV